MRRLISALRESWNRHALVHPLAAGALVLALQGTLPMGQVHFGELGRGETVEVRFRSTGCFHSTRGHITFTGTGTGLRYTAALSESDHRAGRSGRLSHADAARLNLTMQAYRSLPPDQPPDQYCTIIDRVVVTRYILGWAVARESFEDATCERSEGALDFRYLLPQRG